jgi:hypothetical protein
MRDMLDKRTAGTMQCRQHDSGPAPAKGTCTSTRPEYMSHRRFNQLSSHHVHKATQYPITHPSPAPTIQAPMTRLVAATPKHQREPSSLASTVRTHPHYSSVSLPHAPLSKQPPYHHQPCNKPFPNPLATNPRTPILRPSRCRRTRRRTNSRTCRRRYPAHRLRNRNRTIMAHRVRT